MRSFYVFAVGALVALVLAACGGSAEVKAARTARYSGDKATIFAAMRGAVEGKYKVDTVDEPGLGLKTIGRWFNPQGQTAAEGNTAQATKGGKMNSIIPDQSLNIVYAVGLKQDGEAWVVEVKPIIERYVAGSPKTQPLSEGDASIPGWVEGKTEALVVEIHDALKQYEVKGVPQQLPAGNAPPAGSAAPAEPVPAGSAAPAAPPAQ
jgi:hypothetical protein